MRPETLALIGEMKGFRWFESVGMPISGNVARANSWHQAVEFGAKPEWESVQFQVRNLLAYRVNRANYDRFTQWNALVQTINEHVDQIVAEHARPIAQQHKLKKNFENGVAWDLMMACIETEFSDVSRPIFFLHQVLPWYRQGHYPCGWEGPELQPGWEGPMPEGRLIVF